MIASVLLYISHIVFCIALILVIAYYSVNLNKQANIMKTTVQIHKLTGEKLKAISDKRKENGKLLNKQTEILTDLINKLYTKECK